MKWDCNTCSNKYIEHTWNYKINLKYYFENTKIYLRTYNLHYLMQNKKLFISNSTNIFIFCGK